MKIRESVTDLIGGTPLLRLKKMEKLFKAKGENHRKAGII